MKVGERIPVQCLWVLEYYDGPAAGVAFASGRAYLFDRLVERDAGFALAEIAHADAETLLGHCQVERIWHRSILCLWASYDVQACPQVFWENPPIAVGELDFDRQELHVMSLERPDSDSLVAFAPRSAVPADHQSFAQAGAGRGVKV